MAENIDRHNKFIDHALRLRMAGATLTSLATFGVIAGHANAQPSQSMAEGAQIENVFDVAALMQPAAESLEATAPLPGAEYANEAQTYVDKYWHKYWDGVVIVKRPTKPYSSIHMQALPTVAARNTGIYGVAPLYNLAAGQKPNKVIEPVILLIKPGIMKVDGRTYLAVFYTAKGQNQWIFLDVKYAESIGALEPFAYADDSPPKALSKDTLSPLPLSQDTMFQLDLAPDMTHMRQGNYDRDTHKVRRLKPSRVMPHI